MPGARLLHLGEEEKGKEKEDGIGKLEFDFNHSVTLNNTVFLETF